MACAVSSEMHINRRGASPLPAPHADGTPIDPSELPTSLPAYMIYLVPELRVDGAVVATGGAVTMGAVETMKMSFSLPNLSGDVVKNKIEAGEYWGIALDVSRVSVEMMNSVKARLEATKAALEAGTYDGLTKDEVLGDLLYTTAMTYMAEFDTMDYVLSKNMKVNNISFPSEAVFKMDLSVDTSFGVPVSAGASGLAMDVDRLTSLVKAKDGNSETRKQFLMASGMNSSALEHSVPEQLFSTADNPVEAVSAVKAIQIAAAQGIPIYTVTKENIDTVLPQLQLDSLVINELKNVVNAGMEVTVPKTDISYAGFNGVGYIVINPSTGEGAYMISTGDGGAKIVATMMGEMFIGVNFLLSMLSGDAEASEFESLSALAAETNKANTKAIDLPDYKDENSYLYDCNGVKIISVLPMTTFAMRGVIFVNVQFPDGEIYTAVAVLDNERRLNFFFFYFWPGGGPPEMDQCL